MFGIILELMWIYVKYEIKNLGIKLCNKGKEVGEVGWSGT